MVVNESQDCTIISAIVFPIDLELPPRIVLQLANVDENKLVRSYETCDLKLVFLWFLYKFKRNTFDR